VWGDRAQLNSVLVDGCRHIPSCSALFVVDLAGRQISDTVSALGAEPRDFGRDRSTRPYMREAVPAWGFLLSDAYVGLVSHRPSLTALHVVRRDFELLGYVGATFNLKDLPVTAKLYEDLPHWLQIKGDPSIRSTVLLQTRVESPMDQNLDQVLSVIEELLVERGISAETVIPQASISPILKALKDLRLMDDTGECALIGDRVVTPIRYFLESVFARAMEQSP
jgi:hypothetical protein